MQKKNFPVTRKPIKPTITGLNPGKISNAVKIKKNLSDLLWQEYIQMHLLKLTLN